MSAEASGSTKQTSEENVEVKQEEQSAAQEEARVEQAKDNVEEGTESGLSSGADDSSYQSAESDASTRQLQNAQVGVATGGVAMRISRESSVSGGGSGTESQQGEATGGGNGEESQQSGATSRELSQESTASIRGSGTESQQGSGSGTEWQLRDSQGCTTPNNTPYDSSIGDSQETAPVCDTNSQDSRESDVAAGVSNSPDIQETPNSAESFEGDAPPAVAVSHSIPSSPRAEFRGDVGEREELRCYDHCFSKCACVCDYMRPCSRWIRKSIIFMFFKVVLFLIPISAFCMGLEYLSYCPVKKELPILVMLMGLASFVLLGSSLALCSQRLLCPFIHINYFKALRISSRVMLLALFAAGLESTFKGSPSFDSSDHENYCDKVFYYYAYYTNFVVIGIAVLSLFIYVPTLNENMDDYEHL